MGYGEYGYRVRVKGDERLVAYQYLGLTDLGPFTRFANKHSVLIARRDPNELLTLKFPWSPGTGVHIRPTEWLIVNTNAAACDSCSVITDEHFQQAMFLLGPVQPTAENTDTCAKPEVPEDTQKVDGEGCPEDCAWCEESDHDGVAAYNRQVVVLVERIQTLGQILREAEGAGIETDLVDEIVRKFVRETGMI